MVKVGVQIRCTFENVEKIETCHPDYTFYFKLKCSNCGELSDKWHDLTESERTAEDSRNPDGFNFYMKCKLCSRENSIDIVEGSNGNFFFFPFHSISNQLPHFNSHNHYYNLFVQLLIRPTMLENLKQLLCLIVAALSPWNYLPELAG